MLMWRLSVIISLIILSNSTVLARNITAWALASGVCFWVSTASKTKTMQTEYSKIYSSWNYVLGWWHRERRKVNASCLIHFFGYIGQTRFSQCSERKQDVRYFRYQSTRQHCLWSFQILTSKNAKSNKYIRHSVYYHFPWVKFPIDLWKLPDLSLENAEHFSKNLLNCMTIH